MQFCPVTAAQDEPQSEFTFTEGSIEEARDFLRLHGYYIATVDGDQPQVRPFGTAAIFEGEALHHNEQNKWGKIPVSPLLPMNVIG